MRVLLICPDPRPDRPVRPRHAPHHAALVAAALRSAGHHVDLLDAPLLAGGLREVTARAARSRADALLLGVCDYNRAVPAAAVEALANLLRSPRSAVGGGSDRPLVAGFGRLDRASALALMEAVPSLSALAFGEPDFTAGLLVDSPADPAPGVAVRRGGSIEAFEPASVDLDASSVPAWDLVDLGDYGFRPHQSPHERTWPVLASRGCSYSCFWCEVRSRPGWVTRSPGVVVDEICQLRDVHGARTFFLADPIFGLERGWVHDFCAAIVARAPGIRWSCMTRTDRVDEATLRAMAGAGCRNVLFGVESLSADVLERAGKRLDPATVAPALAAARRAGMETVVSLMVGLPGDDPHGFERTVSRAIALDPDFAQFFVVKVDRAPGHGRLLGAGTGDRFEFPGQVYAGDGFESAGQLLALQRRAWRRFYLRPRYAAGRLLRAVREPHRREELARLGRGARLALTLAGGGAARR